MIERNLQNVTIRKYGTAFLEAFGMLPLTYFGAIGDNLTDNYANIQVAIDESISKNVYRQVIYKNEGDPVEEFDGAGKALGIVFLHFDNAAQTENFCKNHNTLIKNILE